MTIKTGTVVLSNKWGSTLLEVKIRHRRANDPALEDSRTFYNVPANGKTEPMNITYQNPGPPFDYWWIEFETISGLKYQTSKNNFFCNIASDDNGDVEIRIDPDTSTMYVIMSYSSGCSQSLIRK